MTYTKRAFWGIFSVLGMYAFGMVFAFLFRILLARNLSVAEYGLYYALFSFFSLIFIARDLGTQSALIKFLPEWLIKRSSGKFKQAFLASLVYSAIVSAVLICISWALRSFIADKFFKLPGIEVALVTFAVASGIATIYALFLSVYLGLQRFMMYSIMGVVQPAILLFATFFFFGFFDDVRAPTFGLLVSNVVMLVIWFFLIFRLVPWSARTESSSNFTKKFFGFGTKMFLAGIGAFILQYTDALMLTYMKSVEEVGLYNAALPFANLFLYMSTAVTTITLPLFSELCVRKMHSHVQEAFRLLYKYSVIVALPVVAVLFAFPDLIIQTVFGADYVSASVVLQVLVWGSLLNVVGQINLSYLNASGKPFVVTSIIAFAAIANFVLNLFLIPDYGMLGAAVATSLSFLLLLVLSAWKLHKLVTIVPPVWAWSKNVLCCIAMIGFMSVLKKVLVLPVWVEAGVVLAAAGVFYVVLVFLLRVIDVKELRELFYRILPATFKK